MLEAIAFWKETKKHWKENTLPEYWCSKCEYWFITTPNEKEGYFPTRKRCTCFDRYEYFKRVIAIMEKANIDSNMLTRYDLDIFKEDVLKVTSMYKFLNKEDIWMYLEWNPGTGKTFSAFFILILAAHLEKSILYVSVPKLLDDLRPSEKDVGKERMEKCIAADVLVMDDIGQEKYSDWVRERLYIIINERYNKGFATVFTSNIALNELHTKLQHPAIISRIRGQSLIFTFKNEDKRKPIEL